MANKGTKIEVHAGGDVEVSADEVGRDKIINRESKKRPLGTTVKKAVTELAGLVGKVVTGIKSWWG